MSKDDPLAKSKEQYASVIEKIKSDNSAVGIDAPLTHAIIIDYLRQILTRLDALEEKGRLKDAR